MSEKVHELIKNRWSPRSFADKGIEKEKIKQLFLAASYAPSCFNEQPWRFIYGTKDYPERYEQLLSCLVEFNQMWVKTAPMIILALSSKKFAKNNKENTYARYDLGLAIGNMSLQATSMGLYVHQMAGFSPEKARELFEVPNSFDIVSMLAIGYLGDPLQLPESLQELESSAKDRKKLDLLLFDGDWTKLE